MENTTEIVIKKVDQNPEVGKLQAKTADRIAFASGLVIKDEESERNAAEVLLAIKDDVKRADAVRKFFVDPYNAYVKAINARFASITDPLGDAVRTINMKLVVWQSEKAKKAEAAKARVMKQVEKGKIEPEQAVEKLANIKQPEAVTRAESTTVSYRTDYRAVISDANAVPRQYCSPDPAKYREVAVALHKSGQPQIPGITVEEIKTPVSRRNF